MPIKSKAQRRFLWSAEARGELKPGTARRWERETDKSKPLPERIKKEANAIVEGAIRGAIAGGIAGSRRSLDDRFLRGVAQGSVAGAVGGAVAGHAAPDATTFQFLAGGATGYIASRGPRGEKRASVKPTVKPLESSGLAHRLLGIESHDRFHERVRRYRADLQSGSHPKGDLNSTYHKQLRVAHGLPIHMDDLQYMYSMSMKSNRGQSASMSKKADMGSHAIELAGLGILARPSIQKLRGKKMSEHSAHAHEIAGLGVLAAPSAYHLGKGVVNKVKSLAVKKLASMNKVASMSELAQVDPDIEQMYREQAKRTVLGTLALQDSDAYNDSPRVAIWALKKLRERGIK